MICSSNFKVWSVHCHGHLASCGEKLTPPHWRAFQPVFNQHHYTPALPTLVSLFTSATAFRVPTDTQNSVMLSYFDWDSLRFITSKMGWEGWERKKKNPDKTLHQSVATEQILSCDPFAVSHMHAMCTSYAWFTHMFFFVVACFVMNIPRWNDSSLQSQRVAHFATGSQKLCAAYAASLVLLMTSAEQTRSADLNLVH